MNTQAAPAALTQVQSALATAADDKLTQIVALVDAMAERGAADALIAPLRPRLSQLRPARPMQLGRLLYLPIDALIVPAQAWSPGVPGFPRALLPHLTAHIERELGARAKALHEAVRRLPAADHWAIQALGKMVWAEAVRILLSHPPAPPPEPVAGLAGPHFAGLVRILALTLRHGIAVQALAARCQPGKPPAAGELRRVLEAAHADGEPVFATAMLLLLRLFPHATSLFGLAERVADPSSPALAQLAGHLIDGLEQAITPAALAAHAPRALAAEIDRLTGLLDMLDRSVAGTAPQPRARLAANRAALGDACAQRFDSELATALVAPATRHGADPGGPDAGALEAVARDLRRLELAAAGAGDPARYAASLERAAAQIAEPNGPLDLCERVRLIEILAGPDAAMAVMQIG